MILCRVCGCLFTLSRGDERAGRVWGWFVPSRCRVCRERVTTRKARYAIDRAKALSVP
jgi:hypothetical protein